ncbi:MAG: thiamine diphosphokinase, partial [Lentisphaeria bacterium]|nr:thiamine diphosphokinase [Lentisphaeria bacterium]
MSEEITVILADGDFPADPVPLSFLEKAERIVCCDGAALALVKHGMTPDAIVGDLDSLSEDFRKRYSECLVHVEEQEDNDLTKAFRYCMENGWKNIVILGATGKREDHTLGNLSLLADYSLQAEKISLVTDHGIFIAVNSPGTFESSKGEQISIFALDAG